MASDAHVLCPHCIIVPMTPRTNGWGGVYLECMDCGYYESVDARTSDTPLRVKVKRAVGCPRKMTLEQAIVALRREARKLGRTPMAREIGTPGSYCPSYGWFRHRFGSYDRAVMLAGLTPRKVGNPTGRNGRERAA